MNPLGKSSPEMVLSGIRVIDFGQGGIDPLATSYLADFGAEVIKVESCGALDFVRRNDMSVDDSRDPDRNLNFARYNQNKLGVLINLKKQKGAALAKRLVGLADIVTENLTVGTLERLGLGYRELQKVKPDIIMLSASFGGQTGPYRNFRGQGFIIHALQGLDDLTGWPDRWPVSPAAAFADHHAPYMWVVLLLAALEHRSQTGKGQFIDASSFEGCLDILDTAIPDFCVNGRAQSRTGNRHRSMCPHGVYRCKGEERWCAMSVGSEKQWEALCRVAGKTAWLADARFATLIGRLKNADELDREVEGWTGGLSAEEVMTKLQEAGVPASVVKNIKDLHQDPQLAYRGHFWSTSEAGMEKFTFEAPPARLSKTPAQFRRRFPMLGEHNDYVYFDLLGLNGEEYAQLVEEQVVY